MSWLVSRVVKSMFYCTGNQRTQNSSDDKRKHRMVLNNELGCLSIQCSSDFSCLEGICWSLVSLIRWAENWRALDFCNLPQLENISKCRRLSVVQCRLSFLLYVNLTKQLGRKETTPALSSFYRFQSTFEFSANASKWYQTLANKLWTFPGHN